MSAPGVLIDRGNGPCRIATVTANGAALGRGVEQPRQPGARERVDDTERSVDATAVLPPSRPESDAGRGAAGNKNRPAPA